MASQGIHISSSPVLKHIAIGTGVVALSYLTYRCTKWIQAEKNLLKRMKWINDQLGAREILIIESDEEWPMVLSRLKADLSQFRVLGLDAEWVPGDNPVALFQLATHSGLVILLRLYKLKTVPAEFRTMMLDKSILKLGVGVINDAKKVGDHYGIQVRGCVELKHLAKRQRKKHIVRSSLSALTETFLGFALVKVKHITCSNWEAAQLSDHQIQYAAADALVAVRIFMKIIECRHNITNLEDVPENFIWQKANSLCKGLVDLEYSKSFYATNYYGIFDKLSGDVTEHPKNEKVENKSFPTRKLPQNLYCKIQTPDGKFLCSCDSRQAKWYVDKGLGKQIADDPITVRLLFEPSGRPQSEKDYYLKDKEVLCVVCGSLEGHCRKMVVPHEYRKFFPPVMKAHSAHDVLLLCTSCQTKSSLYECSLKQFYAKQCDAPLENPKYVVDQDLKSVNSAAKALLKDPEKLPAVRRQKLEELLRNYFGVEELTETWLQEAAGIDPKMQSQNYVPHGKKVVRYVTSHEGLLEFERTWRQHFLDTMKPNFLYTGWSVDHGHQDLQNLNKDISEVIFAGSSDTADTSTENSCSGQTVELANSLN